MTNLKTSTPEEAQFKVMCLLVANHDLTLRELAERLCISVGGLNYCIKALIEKSLVKIKNFTNFKNKFGYGYVHPD